MKGKLFLLFCVVIPAVLAGTEIGDIPSPTEAIGQLRRVYAEASKSTVETSETPTFTASIMLKNLNREVEKILAPAVRNAANDMAFEDQKSTVLGCDCTISQIDVKTLELNSFNTSEKNKRVQVKFGLSANVFADIQVTKWGATFCGGGATIDIKADATTSMAMKHTNEGKLGANLSIDNVSFDTLTLENTKDYSVCLNIMKAFVGPNLGSMVLNPMLPSMSENINEQLAISLSQLDMTAKLNDLIEAEWKVVADPVVSGGALSAALRSTLYRISDRWSPSGSPDHRLSYPAPTPDLPLAAAMSEHIFMDMLAISHKSGEMDEVSEGFMLFGHHIATEQMVLEPPSVTFQNDGAHLRAHVEIRLTADHKNIVGIQMDAEPVMKMVFSEDLTRVYPQIVGSTLHDFRITYRIKENPHSVDLKLLDNAVAKMMENWIPKLNENMKLQASLLPMPEGMALSGAQADTMVGAAILKSNIKAV